MLIEALQKANLAPSGEQTVIVLEAGKAYSLADAAYAASPLPTVSGSEIVIEGNGALLRGTGNGTALILSGRNLQVKNLHLEGFQTGIFIHAGQSSVENVKICGCEFRDISHEAIVTGITQSERFIDGVVIDHCYIEAPQKQRKGPCFTATNLIAAYYNEFGQPLHDIALRHVTWSNNRTAANSKDGNFISQALTLLGACNHAFYDGTDMIESTKRDVSRVVSEDILVTDNEIDGVYDTGLGFVASIPGRRDITLQNVTVRGNRIRYFNTGITVCATNQVFGGDVKRVCTRHVLIEENILLPQQPGPFEPQIGIMLFNTRCESQVISCCDCHMEDITLRGNEINGREVGIAIEAHHATQDLPAPSALCSCSVRQVTIEKNIVRGAQQPLRIFAAHLEGRTDDFWGYPHPAFDPSLPYSTLAQDNTVDQIYIRENQFIEYDCALTVGGAWACGHGFAKSNIVGPELVFSDNHFENGRKVFSYRKQASDQVLYDDAIGFDNRVLGKLTVK